jgi:hypothetical protein
LPACSKTAERKSAALAPTRGGFILQLGVGKSELVQFAAVLAAEAKLGAGRQQLHFGRTGLETTVKIFPGLWAPEKQLTHITS